jgi:NAD(P)H-nitrite reductase large subunit
MTTTGAGTGCGSCRPELATLLRKSEPQKANDNAIVLAVS